jgi:hypothetical protein
MRSQQQPIEALLICGANRNPLERANTGRQALDRLAGSEQALNSPSAIDDPGSCRSGQLDPTSFLRERGDVRKRQLRLNQ